jgi:hypothetical protein
LTLFPSSLLCSADTKLSWILSYRRQYHVFSQKLAEVLKEHTAAMFRAEHVLSKQGTRSKQQAKDGDIMFLQNISELLPDYMASHPRR